MGYFYAQENMGYLYGKILKLPKEKLEIVKIRSTFKNYKNT